MDSNPLLDRIAERMRADDAHLRLLNHWASRAERLVDRPACWMERVGFNRCSLLYCRMTSPLVAWLGARQSAFIRRRYH